MEPGPQLPANASIAQPIGAAQVEATKAFLAWVAELADWGGVGWDRARIAKEAACTP